MIADHSRSRGPAYRWLTFALVIGLCLLPGPARFSAQEKQEEGGDKKEKKDLPLEPDRTIDFETSEGSWISLDVAPDGRAIVFELIGDLYTLPISGGAATRIASGLNFDSQPRYSPDGSKIVFLSDRSGDENVWIANHDGTDPRPLTKGKSTRVLVARVDAGRQVHRRVAFGHRNDGDTALAVSRRRWQRRQPHGKRGAPSAQPDGCGVRQGRSVRLLHRAHGGRQRLQPDELPLAARRVRPPDRRKLPHERRARQRDAARALARRTLARLRHALGRADGSAGSGSQERRRFMADLSGHPGRPGVRVDAGPDARIVVHARFESADHVVRRRHLACRRPVGRSDEDSVHGTRGTTARPEGAVRVWGRPGARARAADSISAPVA